MTKHRIETGVLFGDIHSFHDLNLVLAPFTYKPAEPKEVFFDIPGGNGSIDATEALGEVKFYDREFTFKFTVFPQDTMTFEERQTIVSNALNGKRCNITLDKDADYYWEGRCKVNEYLCDKMLRQIVIIARVKPYKMKRHETVVSFDLASNEQRTIILQNSKKNVVPTIETSGNISISFNEYSDDYVPSTFKDLNICLREGTNTLTLKALNNATTIKFTYREGDL